MSRSTRTLCLLAVLPLALLADGAAAAGGSATDLAVSYTFPADHWSTTAPADFTGAGSSPTHDALSASGWWYRVVGSDTFEHAFPAPATESYSGPNASLTYGPIGPRGFSASQFVVVFDNDRPSGSLRESLCVTNQDDTPLEIRLFHYLDADAGGSPTGDSAVRLAAGYLLITDGGANDVHYQGVNASAWSVRPKGTGNLLGLLNDGSATELDDAGAPAGPADLAAAYQFDLTIAPGQAGCGSVNFSSRVQERLVKGDESRDNMPDLLLQDPTTGEIHSWNLRRTTRMQLSIHVPGPPNWDVVGWADFHGNYSNARLNRDRVTGEVYVHTQPLVGAPTLPFNWKVSATGDFNADGRADILWRNTSSQKLVVWLMNGAQKIGNVVPQPDQAADANWEVAAAADFDADNVLDLLWYNQTSGKLVIWTMDALVHRISGGFTNPSTVGSNAWKAVAAADFGRGAGGERSTEDILWRNDSSGKLVVWHMDSFRNRTSGVFMTPDAPEDPLAFQVVGPR